MRLSTQPTRNAVHCPTESRLDKLRVALKELIDYLKSFTPAPCNCSPIHGAWPSGGIGSTATLSCVLYGRTKELTEFIWRQ